MVANLVSLCARVYARTTGFLLAIHDIAHFEKTERFSLVRLPDLKRKAML
jgi:phage tail protein X